MADNTERSATTGGDVIAADEVVADDGVTSVKVQQHKWMIGASGKDSGRASKASPLIARATSSQWGQFASETARLRKLISDGLPPRPQPGVNAGPAPVGGMQIRPLITVPEALLGYSVARFGSYSSGTGTWTESTGTSGSTNLVQATAGDRPSASTTPGGNACLDFDGVAAPNTDLLTGGNVGGLPGVYGGTYLCACAVKFDVTTSQQIFRSDADELLGIDGSLKIFAGSTTALSNSNITTNRWYRIIVVATSGNVKLYVDGILQTAQGTDATFGAGWDQSTFFNSFEVGSHNDLTALDGQLGELNFAYSATTIPANVIADLDYALYRYIWG